MILADKVMALRKKNGWSQEELAEKLNISRQSVSKWESGASIPDIDKIIALSGLFGVSTDYLLKDNLEKELPSETDDVYEVEKERAVSLEEAAADLADLEGPLTIVGDGARLCCDFLTQRGISCRLAPAHLLLQSAVGVGMAASRSWPGGAVSAQELAPVYLRLSQAERERLAREQARGDQSGS